MPFSKGRGAGRSRSQGPKSVQKRTTVQERKTARQCELATKRRGELSELAFVYKAASEGLAVAKPYGDSERYDFILDNGRRLWRVQIKSTTTLLNGLYHINAGRHTNGSVVPYQPDEIDFLVAHMIPEDTWFLIPVSILEDRISILLAPQDHPRGPGLYGAYREAWHLLRQ
jgi:PD-(D/E)XK endonuclease